MKILEAYFNLKHDRDLKYIKIDVKVPFRLLIIHTEK